MGVALQARTPLDMGALKMHYKRPQTPIINMHKAKKWVGRSTRGPPRGGGGGGGEKKKKKKKKKLLLLKTKNWKMIKKRKKKRPGEGKRRR